MKVMKSFYLFNLYLSSKNNLKVTKKKKNENKILNRNKTEKFRAGIKRILCGSFERFLPILYQSFLYFNAYQYSLQLH